MNNNDFINALGRIDDDLLDRAARYREKGGETREQVRNARQPLYRRIGLIAACLVILLCAIPIAKRAMNGFISSGEQGDFVIENGVLLHYRGEETEVVIPEGVIKISQAAFLSAGDITSIHLPESLEEIESMAFANVLSLKSITVDPNNRHYEIIEKILVKNDGSVIVPNLGDDALLNNGDDFLLDAILLLNDHGYYPPYIEIGHAAITLYPPFSTEYGTWMAVKSVTAFGQMVTFREDEMETVGNFKFQAFEAEGYFVLSNVKEEWGEDGSYANFRNSVLLTEGNTVKVRSKLWGKNTDFSETATNFFAQDGELFYQRIALKYYNIQVVAGVIDVCVARDELYKEIGKITVENGEIIYHPTQVVTVSEAFDLEEEFQLWKEAYEPNADLTLDEVLERNSKIIPRVE